jgi:hypothetical protein
VLDTGLTIAKNMLLLIASSEAGSILSVGLAIGVDVLAEMMMGFTASES